MRHLLSPKRADQIVREFDAAAKARARAQESLARHNTRPFASPLDVEPMTKRGAARLHPPTP